MFVMCKNESVEASISVVKAFFADTRKLATVDDGNITMEAENGAPVVGGVAPTTVRGAPDSFVATFTKSGATPDGGFALEWEGSIGCIAAFTHGFELKVLSPTSTQVYHYEKFTGGVVGCMPAPVAAAIVAEGYVKFELALKAACEKA